MIWRSVLVDCKTDHHSMRSILHVGVLFALCFSLVRCVPPNGVYVSLRSDILNEIGEGNHDVYYWNILKIIARVILIKYTRVKLSILVRDLSADI